MAEFTSHAPSTFSWIDLGTNDTKSAIEFYSELFGWKIIETSSSGNAMDYIIFTLNNKPVAAIYELMPEQKQANLPPYWGSYIEVENIEEVLQKAEQLGAKIINKATEVSNEGKFAVVSDPEGAVFCLWQSRDYKGSAYKYQHGSLCWNELGARNPSAHEHFYNNLFGWTSKTTIMGMGPYTVYSIGETATAGMYQMSEEMKEIPPHWLVYFEIENMDKAMEFITAKGGEILMPKLFIESVGYYAIARDPQGAVFGLVQSK